MILIQHRREISLKFIQPFSHDFGLNKYGRFLSNYRLRSEIYRSRFQLPTGEWTNSKREFLLLCCNLLLLMGIKDFKSSVAAIIKSKNFGISRSNRIEAWLMFTSGKLPQELFHRSNPSRLQNPLAVNRGKMLILLVHNAARLSSNLISSLSAVGDNQSAFTIGITLQSKSNESAIRRGCKWGGRIVVT